MKYKLTDAAKAMNKHEFAVNYGIHFKVAQDAILKGEIEITDKVVIGGLEKDGMIGSSDKEVEKLNKGAIAKKSKEKVEEEKQQLLDDAELEFYDREENQ